MGATIGPDSDFNLVMMALTCCLLRYGEQTGSSDGVTRELRLSRHVLEDADPTGTLGIRFDESTNQFVLELRKGPKGRRVDESVKVIMGG
jgi:hypothetical protein